MNYFNVKKKSKVFPYIALDYHINELFGP